MKPPGPLDGIDDWLVWLETLSPHEIDLGLERIKDVLARLALGRPARVITIAGTNGKGSSAAMLEALLAAGGERVGTYTSPHIHKFNERIRIDGEVVSDRDIVAAFKRIESVRQDLPLTYFEFATLAALDLFDRNRLDTMILEVGLGGRLDAVNAIDPDACLITNITLDHCDWLGNDVESIAMEKAGVMRRDKPVVFGSLAAPQVITSEATRLGAKLILAGRDFSFELSGDGTWNWSGIISKLDGLQLPALKGQHQLQNAAAVLALLDALGLTSFLDKQTIDQSLGGIRLSGRMERISAAEKNFIVDVAHNTDSARALCETVAAIPNIDQVIAVIGVLANKDIAGIVEALEPVVNRWIACYPDSTGAVPVEDLARKIVERSHKPCLIAGSVESALGEAEARATGDDLILITGSFHTVAPALRWLDDFRCAN